MKNTITISSSLTQADFQSAIEVALQIGRLADFVTHQGVFEEYRRLKAQNTLKAQHGDLRLFGDFINHLYNKYDKTGVEKTVGFRLAAGQLYHDPAAWQIVTPGIVKLFRNYLEQEGYTVGSMNRVLSTIRTYARLATSAGYIDIDTNKELELIKNILSTEGRVLDLERTTTRKGKKKAEAVPIPHLVIERLKAIETYPENQVGIRDRLILNILLDHGLRSSEIAGLRQENFDLDSNLFKVYRQKARIFSTLTLTSDSRSALEAYLMLDLPPLPEDNSVNRGTPLLRGSSRVGNLRSATIGRTAVSMVVNKYGNLMAIEHNLPQLSKLSAHDGRHQWATDVLNSGAQVDQLQQAGGWNSPSMPLRYVNDRKVADEGINIGRGRKKSK